MNTRDEKPVAIVTGGASGIGLATVRKFLEQGVRVVALDLSGPPDDLVSDDVRFLECDVSDAASLNRALETVIRRHGRVDYLINNAGVNLVKPIPEVTEAEWDRCLDVNLKAAFLASRFLIPFMKEAGGGVIINVASNAGLLPRVSDPVYCVSKAALIALTKSLALSHAEDRVRANAVCPGPVGNTQIMRDNLSRVSDSQSEARRIIAGSPLAHAEGRMITPEEIAGAIWFLCSPDAKLVTGAVLAVDGGKSLGMPAYFSPRP